MEGAADREHEPRVAEPVRSGHRSDCAKPRGYRAATRRRSHALNLAWVPAFAGMTEFVASDTHHPGSSVLAGRFHSHNPSHAVDAAALHVISPQPRDALPQTYPRPFPSVTRPHPTSSESWREAKLTSIRPTPPQRHPGEGRDPRQFPQVLWCRTITVPTTWADATCIPAFTA